MTGHKASSSSIFLWFLLRLEFGAKWPASLDFGGLFQKRLSVGSVPFPSEPGDVTS